MSVPVLGTFMICGFSLPSSIVFPCKGRNFDNKATFISPFDLVLMIYGIKQISFSEWQVALSSPLSFKSKSPDEKLCLTFCNVPAVVISLAKSQFADTILLYRQFVKSLCRWSNIVFDDDNDDQDDDDDSDDDDDELFLWYGWLTKGV